ncbi:MAG: hypothetical protein GXY07_03465 [Candidatus Hydrogenedentes bacterium]|jgi:hypothetical protein|nr:hypothetical protein [Candidatus Hydrogenedentota bacterium]
MSKFEYTMGKEVDLKAEWEKTLADPGLHSNFILKTMYAAMDLIYGKGRELEKFMVIEVLARYPYMAWETGSYLRLTRDYTSQDYPEKQTSDFAWHHIEMGRRSQDNEQWHLFILDDLMRQQGLKRKFFKHFLMPRLLAWGYYYLTRVMYRIKPELSFDMNARFESHAEREYAKAVVDHPQWEETPIDTAYFEYYPRVNTLADLFRRISLDERDHKHESWEEYENITGKEFKP